MDMIQQISIQSETKITTLEPVAGIYTCYLKISYFEQEETKVLEAVLLPTAQWVFHHTWHSPHGSHQLVGH